MPVDIQSLLAALGLGAGGITGSQAGGPLPPGGGPAMMQPRPQMVPGSTGMPQMGAPTGFPGMFGSGGGGPGIGPMGLLGAGASMLNASGPGNAGIGPIIGAGLGGFMQGGQLDAARALQQQQQSALQRIAEQLMKSPTGAQPVAGIPTPTPTGAPPTTPLGAPPTIPAAPAAPTTPLGAPPTIPMGMGRPASIGVPGAPPVPGPNPGGMAFGGPQQQGPNPFIQMMLARRMGRMA